MAEEVKVPPNGEEEESEARKQFRLVFRTLVPTRCPSSYEDAVSVDIEKLSLDEKAGEKADVHAVEENGNDGVGAFVIDQKREEKLEAEGEDEDNETEKLAGDAHATPKVDDAEKRRMEFNYPHRPGVLDCAYYMRTGICGYGENCRFNHPPRSVGIKVAQYGSSRLAGNVYVEKVSVTSKGEDEDIEKEELPGLAYATPNDDETEKKIKIGEFPYPERPGVLDCTYYLRTGACSYGANCKFNHPPRTKGIQVAQSDYPESAQKFVYEDKKGLAGMVGQTECKYFLTPGGCKYGNACKFGHSQEKSEIRGIKLNFLGLPVRPGQKECPYYMNTGSCKFSSNCYFNHPDPTVMNVQDHALGCQNGGPPKMHASNYSDGNMYQSISHSDSLPTSMPSMPLPFGGLNCKPNFRSQTGYVQQPSFTTLATDTEAVQQPTLTRHPERPGQPECPYFMKTGDCKFGSACKFHHPRSRLFRTSTPDISPLGLPLRPDKPICAFYSRFRICKFGSACKFNHPMEI